MKITIDEKICKKHHLTLQEALLALVVRVGKVGEVFNNLKSREIAVKHDSDFAITQPWSDVLDEIICDSSEGMNDEKRLSALAKNMRECFPEGKMSGTAYYYRCNNREVILKLKKFFLQYGDYSDDDIIDATKRFVAAYKGDHKFMPLIKYFIMKNKKVQDEDGEIHIQEVSELASYLENKTSEEIPVIDNADDWLMNSRN